MYLPAIFSFAAGCRVLLPPPYPLPPSKREAGELKLVSSLRGALALDILLLVEGSFHSPPLLKGGESLDNLLLVEGSFHSPASPKKEVNGWIYFC